MAESENSIFVGGLELSEKFFLDKVQPVFESEFAEIPYSAALIGNGSEVLGFDTVMSSDHCWGPRVILFLKANDFEQRADEIIAKLRNALPATYGGYATSFSAPAESACVANFKSLGYGISLYTIDAFFSKHLGFDISEAIRPIDWLTFPEQKLATIISGRVFHDDLGLDEIRQRFAYYPHEVWLYLLVCAWTRIEQEEHLMGRAGYVGDELGSAIIAGRLVRDLMRICFLLEGKYAPYPKWFGTAFAKLNCAAPLLPILREVLQSDVWMQRQEKLCQAYELVAEMHNASGITSKLNTRPIQFFDRPFMVISAGAFSQALAADMRDTELQTLLQKPRIGSIDQFSDSTDLLSNSSWRTRILSLYE